MSIVTFNLDRKVSVKVKGHTLTTPHIYMGELILYVRIIIWGFSTKYVHMYIIIWDLLHQAGTYVRIYVHHFWGIQWSLY